MNARMNEKSPASTRTSGTAARVSARVSVVVLTCNRCTELVRTLEKLQALPEAPPIIVVDNASGDGTAAAVRRRFPRVDLIVAPRNLGAAARNLGIAAARTPYVACADDDCWWRAGSLAQGAALFDAHPRLAVLCARILIGERETEDPVSALMARSPLDSEALPGRALLGFMAGASMFRVAAFREAGGYCSRLFLGGEEQLLAYELAARRWQMAYVAELVVHHFPSPARDSARRRLLLARNAVWTAWMRLPAAAALEVTRQRLAAPELRGARAALIAETLRGLPWALARRRVIPPQVELARRQVEAMDALGDEPGPGAQFAAAGRAMSAG